MRFARGGRFRCAEHLLFNRPPDILLGQRRRAVGRQGDVADHDAHATAVHVLRAGIVKRLRAGGQQQVNGRIEFIQEFGRKIERSRVDRRRIGDETAAFRVDLIRLGDFGVVRVIDRQCPAVRRHVPRCIPGVDDVRPKFLEIACAGKNAADADDRHAALRKCHARVSAPT